MSIGGVVLLCPDGIETNIASIALEPLPITCQLVPIENWLSFYL